MTGRGERRSTVDGIFTSPFANRQEPYMRRQRKPFVVEIKKTRRLFPRPPSKSDVPLEKANLDDEKRVRNEFAPGARPNDERQLGW